MAMRREETHGSTASLGVFHWRRNHQRSDTSEPTARALKRLEVRYRRPSERDNAEVVVGVPTREWGTRTGWPVQRLLAEVAQLSLLSTAERRGTVHLDSRLLLLVAQERGEA